MNITRRSLVAAGVAAAATLALAGCGTSQTVGGSSGGSGSSGSGKSIVIGSANFPENQALAEAYGQALEKNGWTVSYKLNIGARAAYFKALQNSEINFVPEYAGALLAFLNSSATAKSSSDVDQQLSSALPKGLTELQFSDAADSDSLNVTQDFATKNDLSSIGDLAKLPSVTLAANPEFDTRPDGVPGLKSVYGLDNIQFQAINDGGGPATLKALTSGTVDVADIYSTTPSIQQSDLVTLKDPKNLFASQQVVPIVTSSKATSEMKSVVNKVSAKLTTSDLRSWNERMSGSEKASPETVAKDWLDKSGLFS